jgi:hypothetical protein
MTSDDPRPEPPNPLKASDIEAATMDQLAREAIETIGADAIIVVWTKQRKRKTEIKSTAIGNMLTVHGLMRYVRDKINDIEEPEVEEDEDDEDDE